MGIFDGFRERRLKKEEAKRLKELDAQLMKKRLLSEISRAHLSASTMETKMDRKMRVACNKAYLAKQHGDKAVMRNAYQDIKVAVYFKKVASGLASALDRLESNLQFANIAENMQGTLEKAASLTSANPTIDVSKLSLLYDKVMGPLSMIADSMNDFGEMNMDIGIENLDISDEEVERLISSMTQDGKVSEKELNKINVGAEFIPKEGANWADEAGDYIENLFKSYGFKK